MGTHYNRDKQINTEKIRVYLTCEAFKIVISPCMSDILFKITTVNVLWDLTGKKNKEPSQKHIGLVFLEFLY